MLNVLQSGTYSEAGRLVRAALQQFVRQKTNPKLAGRSLHPIHHLLILWNGGESRSLISILPVKVDKAPEASVDTSSTDLIICPGRVFTSFFFFIFIFQMISDQIVNQLHVGLKLILEIFAFMSESDLFLCSVLSFSTFAALRE